MYKNNTSKYYNTGRDSPDLSELLDAAGIDPRGTPEFVREVKFAVLRGAKETKNFTELARYLNNRNILNARGYPWTHSTLEAFVKHYRPQSN
jgi:hypothetical protein